MTLRRLTPKDSASTSSVSLIVAAAVFAAGFLVAQVMVASPAGLDPRASIYTSDARTALDVMVREPGMATTGGAWALDADKLSRFGLALPGQPNFIDYVKIKALRNGTLVADPTNKAPDYPEVRKAIGLKEGDFHLRTYPVIPGLEDPRWTQEARGRLAYFAHYTGGNAPVEVATVTALDLVKLNVSVTLVNVGVKDAVYKVAVSLGDKDSKSELITESRHTRLLAPGGSQTVWVNFYALPSWDASIDATHVHVTDAYGKTAIDATGTEVGDVWYAITPPTGNTYTVDYLVSAGDMYYVSGDVVHFIADYHDGSGAHKKGGAAITGRFVLVGPNGKEWVNQSVTFGDKKNDHFDYACTNCTTVGNYTAVLWGSGMVRKHIDVVHVSALKMFTEKATIGPLATGESAILQTLIKNFTATRFDSLTNREGDIFGDDSNGPNEITEVLSRYTWLVIGSEVTQTALDSASTKYAIADWVQAGGNLIVLGTTTQQSRWLQPIYHAMQVNANGGIGAPDPTHPILLTPDRLEYDRYMDRGRAWNIRNDQPFTHVLSRGASSANSIDDTLTVNNPGTLGNGTVVLTSYMPGSLTDPQDTQEAKKFLHNLMSQSYTMLFLDYGPIIPEGVPVGSSERLVAIPHPNVPGAVVEVRLVMYVFG